MPEKSEHSKSLLPRSPSRGPTIEGRKNAIKASRPVYANYLNKKSYHLSIPKDLHYPFKGALLQKHEQHRQQEHFLPPPPSIKLIQQKKEGDKTRRPA
eukprot:1159486-Pelagomonas_calceolata.AAC.7